MLVLAPGIDSIVELMAIDKIISITLIKFALVNNFNLIEVISFVEQFEQARITTLGSSQMPCPRQSLKKERGRIFLFSLFLILIKVKNITKRLSPNNAFFVLWLHMIFLSHKASFVVVKKTHVLLPLLPFW